MNKKSKLLRLIVFLSLVFIAVLGIYIPNVNNSLNNNDQCLLTNTNCSFNTNTFNFSMTFNQKPIIEEELFINFNISSGYKIKNAWIEGVNMYMGKTPVIFTEPTDKSNVEAVTFLGSCSQANMNWQLFIEVESPEEKSKTYSVYFSTNSN